MILLHRLRLENFLSHEETKLTFSNSEKLLIDGNSGSGKSAIVEAIVWCLYGKARVDNRFLVRRGADKCVVTLELDGEGNTYTIRRSATLKGGHTIEVLVDNGEGAVHIDRNGVREIQDWIENELLHASYLLFVNSIAYVQDNSDTFVKQSAAKRKELLLEIIRANQYGEFYKKATDLLSSKLVEDARVSGSIEALTIRAQWLDGVASGLLENERGKNTCEKQLKTAEESLLELNKEIRSIENDFKEIMFVTSNLTLLKQVNDRLIDEKKTERKYIESYTSSKELVDKKLLEIEAIGDVEPKILSLSKKISDDYGRAMRRGYLVSNRAKQIDYAAQIVDIDKQIKPLRENADSCPSGSDCPLGAPLRAQISFLTDEKERRQGLALEQERVRQKQEEEEISLEKPLITEEEKELYTVYQELGTKREKLESEVYAKTIEFDGWNKGDSLEDKLKDIILRQDKNDKEMQVAEARFEELKSKAKTRMTQAEMNDKVTEMEGFVRRNKALIKDCEEKIAIATVASAELANNKLEQEKLTKEMVKIKDEIDGLKLIKEAFSQKGIPAVVVDYMVPQLENRINDILSQLSDFKMRIDTQRKNAAGDGLVEGLFLTIYNESGEEFDFDSYSGGQKLKITVAISEALASLQKVGFRIMDETFTALDEESTDEFVEVMEKLQSQFKQILCITHLRNVKDLFDKKVTVTRVNNLSEVI